MMNSFVDAVTKIVQIILNCLVRCRLLKAKRSEEKAERRDRNAHVLMESFSKENSNHKKGRKTKKGNVSCFDNFSETKSCSCFPGEKTVENLKRSVLKSFEKERLHLEKEQSLFEYLSLCVSCFESDCESFCEQLEKFCGVCVSPKKTRCLRRKLRILFEAHTKLKRKIETFEKNNFGSEVAQKAAGNLYKLLDSFCEVLDSTWEQFCFEIEERRSSDRHRNSEELPQGAPVPRNSEELPQGAPVPRNSEELPQGAPVPRNSEELPQGAPVQRNSEERPQGAPVQRNSEERPQGAPVEKVDVYLNEFAEFGFSNANGMEIEYGTGIEQDFVENPCVTKKYCDENGTESDLDFAGENAHGKMKLKCSNGDRKPCANPNGRVSTFDNIETEIFKLNSKPKHTVIDIESDVDSALDFTGEKCREKVGCVVPLSADVNCISEVTWNRDYMSPIDGVSYSDKNVIPNFEATPKNSLNTHIESVVLNSESRTFNQKSRVQNVRDVTVHEKPILCCGSGELPGVQGPAGPYPANKNQAGASGNEGNAAVEKLIEGMERLMVLNAQQIQALNRQSEQAADSQRQCTDGMQLQAAAPTWQNDIQLRTANDQRPKICEKEVKGNWDDSGKMLLLWDSPVIFLGIVQGSAKHTWLFVVLILMCTTCV